jgi:hypothetical protein
MRLLYIALSILIASCAPSKMNVEKGTFQAMKPPNIYGNERYLEEGKHSTISFDANIGKNKTIQLPGLTNEYVCLIDGRKCLEETPANINYRLIENTLGFQFFGTIKDNDDIYMGFGGGIQNFPYGFLMLGYNREFMEFGGVAFGGLVSNKASYEGMWRYYSDNWGWNVDYDYYEYIKIKDIKILHSYGGLVAHASFYWKKFALNYAASISNPWFLVDELYISPSPHSKDAADYYADISFSFPVLLMQDIGISYAPNNIKYRLGVNQITGVKFPGQYWGLSVQVAYGW